MPLTLEVAKRKLETWLEAEDAVSTSQSYTIGSRTLTRANLADIRDAIDYWSAKVAQLENSGTQGIILKRVMPVDF